MKLNTENSILISSHKNKEATIQIPDESLEGMSLKVEYKHGSFFLVADMTNFIETYDVPSAYFKLHPDERHMIHPGDIF